MLVGGLNFVAVRFSNRELPPFEGAALRFAAASLLFLAYVRFRGIALPRGRSLIGATLFGLLGFSGAYAFLYWGLVSAPAAMGSVALALVPVATPLLAAAHGRERIRARRMLCSNGLVKKSSAPASIPRVRCSRSSKPVSIVIGMSAAEKNGPTEQGGARRFMHNASTGASTDPDYAYCRSLSRHR